MLGAMAKAMTANHAATAKASPRKVVEGRWAVSVGASAEKASALQTKTIAAERASRAAAERAAAVRTAAEKATMVAAEKATRGAAERVVALRKAMAEKFQKPAAQKVQKIARENQGKDEAEEAKRPAAEKADRIETTRKLAAQKKMAEQSAVVAAEGDAAEEKAVEEDNEEEKEVRGFSWRPPTVSLVDFEIPRHVGKVQKCKEVEGAAGEAPQENGAMTIGNIAALLNDIFGALMPAKETRQAGPNVEQSEDRTADTSLVEKRQASFADSSETDVYDGSEDAQSLDVSEDASGDSVRHLDDDNEAELLSIDKSVIMSSWTQDMQLELASRAQRQDSRFTIATMDDLEKTKVIGEGGHGTVYEVEHKKTKRRYALKKVPKKDGKIPEEVARECAILGENDHPFIAQFVRGFVTSNSVYMLMELVTGGDLYKALHGPQSRFPKGMSRVQCQFYAGSIILMLESLHARKLAYRDLKPENLMLDAEGYLKLVDFGLTKRVETRTFSIKGTPHYLAPEVLMGCGYGTEVDIWALGVLCFELVCRTVPFGAEEDSPVEICRSILRGSLKFPRDWKDELGRTMIKGLLAKDCANRLGVGMNGIEDIKTCGYFKASHHKAALFSKLLDRELEPPVKPSPCE